MCNDVVSYLCVNAALCVVVLKLKVCLKFVHMLRILFGMLWQRTGLTVTKIFRIEHDDDL